MTISVRSPTDVGGKNVFVLNDIDFNIPPSQIEVRNENLIYQYKTLRTKVSTKVPTGHGQAVINTKIAFTPSTLLDLHRLIVQFRFSPFFYLDNRYIRETLVPDWPWTQNMAVTITGLNVSSMAGSSDTLIAELDMLWFNYFPYMHNYYYREEWQTNWIRDERNPAKSYTRSIGWTLDPSNYKRTHCGSTIGGRDFEEAKNLQSEDIYPGAYGSSGWSISQSDFKSSTNRTIFEMEAEHPGVEFDLLPIPGNMMPARIVTQPRYSHIFVRFMNLMQKDALFKNFGIDVDQDLVDYETTHHLEGQLWNRFFTIGKDSDGNPFVAGLHTMAVPSELRNKWIAQMRGFNHGVKFMYNGYKEIRLPQKFIESTQNKRNRAVMDLNARVVTAAHTGNNVLTKHSAMVDIIDRIIQEKGLGAWRVAFITNAYAESALNPLIAAPPPYDAVGLFQLDTTGLGKGLTVAQRQDPVFNTTKIVEEFFRRGGATANPTTEGEAVAWFARNVERCAACGYQNGTGELFYRQALADRIFGAGTQYQPFGTTGLFREENKEDDIYDYLETQQSIQVPENTQTELLNVIKNEFSKQVGATEEEADALAELFQILDAEGWTFYDKDSSITNVWEKQLILDIKHSGLDRVTGVAEEPEAFRHAGIICTSIAGGINHIVSKIPILSHEWPTHQHLGSIEPSYQLEFAVLDDQSDLEGIGSMAQLVQGMRSVLQSNSRKFRPVLDAHCVATDTFITRLLGSYQNNDFTVLEAPDGIVDYDLKKKTVITNSYAGTVEGNPGLSVINYSLQETNPYEAEVVVSTAPALQDKEASRKLVLQAINKLEVVEEYKSLVAALFIGSKINPNITDPKSDAFGKFLIKKNPDEVLKEPYYYTGDIYDGTQSPDSIVFPYENLAELDWLNTLGIQYDNTTWGDGWAAIPSTYLDSASTQSNYSLDYGGPAALFKPSIIGTELEISSTESLTYNLLDMAKINDNSDIDFAAFQRFADYYVAIRQTLETSERIFAEFEVGGLTKSFLSDFLYGLPIKTNMWKIWQIFLEEFAKTRYSYPDNNFKISAIEQLNQNPSWPTPGKASWADASPDQYRAELNRLIQTTFSQHAWNTMDYLTDPLVQAYSNLKAGLSSSRNLSAYQEENRTAAISRLVNYYLWSLPISFSLPDWIKATYGSYIGSVISSTDLDSSSATSPALRSTYQSLFDNADSCGNIVQNYTAATQEPVWIVTDQTIGQRGGFLGHNLDSLITPTTTIADETLFRFKKNSNTYSYVDSAISKNLQSLGVEDYLRPFQQVGKIPGSPFIYPTDEATEQQKAFYIKNILATFADGILADYAVLKIIGQEQLMFLDASLGKGKECYPDIELPAHPYYGDTKMVTPDFFMWNIYEDGGAFNSEEQARIQTQVDAVVLNAYQSMKRLEKGDTYDTNSDTVLSEASINSQFRIDTKISAEATDGNAQNGVSSTPFYPVQAAAADTKKWADALAGIQDNSTTEDSGFSKRELEERKAKYGEDGLKNIPSESLHLYSTKPSDFLQGLRMSNAEGVFGSGQTGLQYPGRLGAEQYTQLKTEFEATTQMFGSVEGYMNQQLDEKNAPAIQPGLVNTNLERPFEIAHTFDIKSLQHLSRDSAKDMLSQKMSLKRAFPTFKLFFIEEDEFETRFLNFDDFYSYNAIKSMNVVLSRKIPADTAIITLQNVQGSLDGTRRNTVVDLDYFAGDTAKKKLQAAGDTEANLLDGGAVTTGTSAEQPFAAVVLRPGLNVQLRVGYSNNADNLHTLISGRVVDVTWNQSGDLAEILIQSFGTELAQVLKGTSRDSNITTYRTTHELLASMMLEPEITHFGRWEFGQTYFIGEAKDHKLDFVDYSTVGYLGKFQTTDKITNWIFDHPGTVLALGVAATAASFIPYGGIGKVLGRSKIGKAILGKSATAGFGKFGYRAIWGNIAQDTAGLTGRELQAALAGSSISKAYLANSIDESLTVLGQAAVKSAANAPEMAALVAKRTLESKSQITGMLLANQIDDATKLAAETERYFQTLSFKSRWMTKPWVELGSAGFMSSFGTKPISTALTLAFTNPGKLAAAGIAIGASLDIANMLSNYIGNGAVKQWLKNFFGRKQATLFLTPQDDNLFPPHPKDYMTLDDTFYQDAFKFITRAVGAVVFNDPETYNSVYRTIFPNESLSKKASPSAYNYQPVTSTVWDIFEEMSIRHPGWIYGARPYGNAFRYTMFFGLPAQRYWARPSSNGLIYRANQLRKTLDSSNNLMITEAQFEQLYGKQLLEEILFKIETTPVITNMSFADEAERQKIALQQTLGSYALKEYLRALEIRFEPFRRYHLFTSDRDIIWNGIIGTENAVSNAVDVTYFTEENIDNIYDFGANSVQTAVFKAHAFIPENQLRIAPVRWPNCKGYSMAMRYGMGELLTRIKDMYRGEILLMGNARIRPWDIAILVDTYNDIVGPVEIEQVVHTFSHETGFITEIKPSAVAFANEISGWPLIEGMKLYAMAIHDIHSKYHGMSASQASKGLGDPGILENVAGLISNSGNLGREIGFDPQQKVMDTLMGNKPKDYNSKFESFMKEKYSRIFGADGASIQNVIGSAAPPNLSMVDGIATDMFTDLGIGMGVAGSALALGGSVIAFDKLIKKASTASNAKGLLAGIKAVKDLPAGSAGKIFVKNPAALAVIAASITLGAAGIGTVAAANYLEFPSIGWLMGSTVLFMQCLRTDAIMLVPLIKGGTPIVAGLATNDPAMIWKTFRGKVERIAQETIGGTSDMLQLYTRYGSALWEEAKNDGIWNTSVNSNTLTGEVQGIATP